MTPMEALLARMVELQEYVENTEAGEFPELVECITDLLALVDGLTMQGLTDPDRFPPAHLIAVLERHIARLPAGSAPSER